MVDYNFFDCRIRLLKFIIISSILIPGIRCDANDDDFCWHPECKNLGEDVLGNMMPSVDPCQDFYEYACGRFTENHPPPTMDSNYSVVEVILKRLYSKLKELLSRKIIPTESQMVRKSKRLFQTCMNITKINRNAIKDMKKVMDDIGGFPMMYPPDMFDNTRPWEKVHSYYARLTGYGSLFNIDVNQDYRDKSRNAIYLDQPAGIFGRFTPLTDPAKILQYATFLKDIVVLMVSAAGTKATPQDILQDIRNVFRFRYLLQMTMSTGQKRVNAAHDSYTLDGLQQATPSPMTDMQIPTDWTSIFKDTFRIIKNANIEGNTEILVREPTYILGLPHRILATELRVIVNHIHLYFLEKHLKYMSENILTRLYNITDVMSGFETEKLERWDKCIQDHPMQHVLSSIYIHWYFPQAERAKVITLITNIKKAMKNRIHRATWLDDTTRQEALLKIDKMKNVIGSEEWYRHYDTELQEYYKGQNVGWNYLQNVLDFEQNEYKIELAHLTGESVRINNEDFPILPNAYYEKVNNMVINVGQMQPPFYHSKFPPVVNYPGLGTVVAHEMSHGFDKTGRRYNHAGLRVNWWSNSSFLEYQARSQCLIDQFNNYGYKELESTHPDWRVKGKFTLNENFADLLGIQISYEAYKKKIKQFVKPSRIPTLRNFDNDRVFFLIYANTFCEHTNQWTFEYRTNVDTHTSARLRVNGPLSNMPEFSDAFQCAPGTPLNRVDKCKIW